MHEKISNTTSTSALIEKAVGRMVRERTQKQASQLSPNSVPNQENSSSEQYVSQKLRHTGENYAPAGQTSYGLQQTRDLHNQGPNTGPLAETASDIPQNRDPKKDIPGNPLMDCLDSAGETEEGTSEPDNQGDPVSEKLQLKKDASALIARLDETSKLGQQINERFISLIVAHKSGSISDRPEFTPESILTETQNQPSPLTEKEAQWIKQATLEIAEDAVHAASVTALALKQAAAGLPDEEAAMAMQEPFGTAAADIPPADVGVNGAGEISEDEARALMLESLAENGVLSEDGDLGGDFGSGENLSPGIPGNLGDGGSIAITPEEMALFQQAMQESGISQDEIAEAIAEIEAEKGVGVSNEDGVLADKETEKTGHYKFANLVNRQAKTAEQEKRAAGIRSVIRDFCYGPDTSNFN